MAWRYEKNVESGLLEIEELQMKLRSHFPYYRHSFKNYESAREVGKEAPTNVAGGRINVWQFAITASV